MMREAFEDFKRGSKSVKPTMKRKTKKASDFLRESKKKLAKRGKK